MSQGDPAHRSRRAKSVPKVVHCIAPIHKTASKQSNLMNQTFASVVAVLDSRNSSIQSTLQLTFRPLNSRSKRQFVPRTKLAMLSPIRGEENEEKARNSKKIEATHKTSIVRTTSSIRGPSALLSVRKKAAKSINLVIQFRVTVCHRILLLQSRCKKLKAIKLFKFLAFSIQQLHLLLSFIHFRKLWPRQCDWSNGRIYWWVSVQSKPSIHKSTLRHSTIVRKQVEWVTQMNFKISPFGWAIWLRGTGSQR